MPTTSAVVRPNIEYLLGVTDDDDDGVVAMKQFRVH